VGFVRQWWRGHARTPSPLVETIRASVIGDDEVMDKALRPPADHLRRLHRRRRRGPQVRKGADVSIDQAREAHRSDADGRGTTEGGDDQE
jgi:hypothetical protein